MIEDKKIGLKIAENKYEKLATRISEEIEGMETNLEINKVILDYVNKRNKEWKKKDKKSETTQST